ncbi:Phytochrome-like protein cph2 [bacterium HR15]|nr:Phytochrome-like protein cph2 [bacterium HR15]
MRNRWLILRGLWCYATMRLWLRWAQIPVGKRLALGMFATITALLLPYLLLSFHSMHSALEEQQRLTLLRQLKAAQILLDHESQQLLRTVEDYSVWEEFRDAMLQGNREWVRTNILEWALPHFYLDAIVIFDQRGQVAYRAGKPVPGMERASNPLLQRARQGSSGMGFLREGNALYYVAYAPVLGEHYSPPQAGVLMFAKQLDKAQLARLWGRLNSTVQLIPPERVHGEWRIVEEPPGEPSAGKWIDHTHHSLFARLNGELTMGIPLYGIDGQVVALLTVSTPSVQVQAMQQAMRRTSLYLLAAGLLLTAGTTIAVLLMLRRHLTLFLQAANRLAAGMWEVRVPYPAHDEFGVLARTFNQMADQLQTAFEHQEQQRLEIEKQKTELEQLYEQLQQANQELETANQELLAMNTLLSQAAITDSLTGLRNHRAFQESLLSLVQIAERYQQPLSLIMLDIDHFKQFNDRFGHPAGDELLRQVATVLRQSARASDVVARYGGEEFAILLPNTDLNEAVQVAERLRQQIAAIQNPHAHITASFGIATHRKRSAPATLLYEADSALYEAKRRGRNRICIYGADAYDAAS